MAVKSRKLHIFLMTFYHSYPRPFMYKTSHFSKIEIFGPHTKDSKFFDFSGILVLFSFFYYMISTVHRAAFHLIENYFILLLKVGTIFLENPNIFYGVSGDSDLLLSRKHQQKWCSPTKASLVYLIDENQTFYCQI